MKKREFIKKLGVSGIAMANASLIMQSCISQGKKETGNNTSLKNWAWVRPQIDTWSLDDWKRQLASAKESGIDAILLESYNGHSALYQHPDPRIITRADLLEDVIKICKENDLEFHAWMWSMICNAESIVKDKTDWYNVNGLGQPANTNPAYVNYYKFMDPLHPEVQEFVQTNVRSLAEIDGVDGVHLDYIRMPDVILAEGLQPNYNIVQDKEYPEYDYHYTERARAMFKEQTGIDPVTDLKDPSANREWRQFRYDAVTNLVNDFLAPEARKFGKQVTAAVFPNWESVRQQWQNWDLDAFLPMLYHGFYNREIDFIEEHTRKNLQLLNNEKPIYSGLFMGHVKEDIQKAYDAAIRGGAKGVSLFSLEGISEDQWKILKEVLNTQEK